MKHFGHWKTREPNRSGKNYQENECLSVARLMDNTPSCWVKRSNGSRTGRGGLVWKGKVEAHGGRAGGIYINWPSVKWTEKLTVFRNYTHQKFRIKAFIHSVESQWSFCAGPPRSKKKTLCDNRKVKRRQDRFRRHPTSTPCTRHRPHNNIILLDSGWTEENALFFFIFLFTNTLFFMFPINNRLFVKRVDHYERVRIEIPMEMRIQRVLYLETFLRISNSFFSSCVGKSVDIVDKLPKVKLDRYHVRFTWLYVPNYTNHVLKCQSIIIVLAIGEQFW